MKILIVNERLIEGGTEIYVLNLKKLLEKDNEVYLLTFDNEFEKNILKVKSHQNIINIKSDNKFNKLIFNPFMYWKIRKELKKIQPDRIIVNNLFCSPITQINALKKYKTYQVVHDYSIVCPKSTCLKDSMSICQGYKSEQCYSKCCYHNSKMSLIIKLYLTKKMEKLKKKNIKKFITPSLKLNEYLKSYEYNSVSINNPIRFIEFENYKKDYKLHKYIYVGAINENKGIFKFLEAFNKFAKNKNVQIEIVGKPSSENDKKRLESLISENSNIINLGYINNHEVLTKVKESNYMVVPSLWIENYPTTVLESMMVKTIVIGSNRGGIPEMLDENRGILFNIMKEESIIEVLEKTYTMSIEEYGQIIDNAYEYVKKNNSYELYYKEIMKVLNED